MLQNRVRTGLRRDQLSTLGTGQRIQGIIGAPDADRLPITLAPLAGPRVQQIADFDSGIVEFLDMLMESLAVRAVDIRHHDERMTARHGCREDQHFVRAVSVQQSRPNLGPGNLCQIDSAVHIDQVAAREQVLSVTRNVENVCAIQHLVQARRRRRADLVRRVTRYQQLQAFPELLAVRFRGNRGRKQQSTEKQDSPSHGGGEPGACL